MTDKTRNAAPAKRAGLIPLVVGLSISALSLVSFVFRYDVAQASPAETELQAQRYIQLALSLNTIQEGEVDAWYGTTQATPANKDHLFGSQNLHAEIESLEKNLSYLGHTADEQRRTRLRQLVKQLKQVNDITSGATKTSFYKQSSQIFGVTAPTYAETQRWKQAREQLDAMLPGVGTLAERAKTFQARFLLPEARKQTIFERALAECRQRTVTHWQLPKNENVKIQWDSSIPAAWHHYKGHYQSTLRINQQAIALPGQALNLACHEGYPGHHTQFVLEDAASGPERHEEAKLTLLRSHESVIREGAADAAVNLVFPLNDRIAFFQNTLFPLAQLNPAEAPLYARFEALQQVVAAAALPILARYYDHEITADQADIALKEEALISSPQALLAFTQQYGGYVTGYTIVRDRISATLSQSCGSEWSRLRAIVEEPQAQFPLPDAGGLDLY